MNEPDLNLNNPGCEVNKWNNPPYVPNVPGLNLVTKTACLSSNQYLSKTYNLHSLYGYSETVATMNALKAVLKYVGDGGWGVGCVCFCSSCVVSAPLVSCTAAHLASFLFVCFAVRCRERPIVISRSTFAGTGYHGSHWLGDNDSAWADLYVAVVVVPAQCTDSRLL